MQNNLFPEYQFLRPTTFNLNRGPAQRLGVNLISHRPTIMGHREANGLSIDVIVRALEDARTINTTIQQDTELYGGGVLFSLPPCFYTVMGDTYGDEAGENRVVKILKRSKLPCGVPVCLVVGKNVLTGVQREVSVVPSGQEVHDYAVESMGKYVFQHGSVCITQHRYTSMVVDPCAPLYPKSGPLKALRYKVRLMIYTCYVKITSLFQYKAAAQTFRTDLLLLQFLYNQRLGTSASLNTAPVLRIIESAAIKRAGTMTSEQTLKTTVDYFIQRREYLENSSSVQDCLIVDMTTFPAIMDPQVVLTSVGRGYFYSSTSESSVAVVDNHNFKVKSAKGASLLNGCVTFDEPYDRPERIFFYGPHPASAAIKLSTKSTHNMEDATKRLTNSRGFSKETGYTEKSYRCAADYITMTTLGYGAAVPVPSAIRDTARKFKAFGDWGLDFKDYHKHKRKLEPELDARLQTVAALLTQYTVQLQSVADLFRAEIATINSINFFEGMKEYAEQDHVKKAERIATFFDMVDYPFKFDPLLQKTYVDGKVKWEIGKHKKLARCFVSLGCPKTLFAPQIPEMMKTLMDRTCMIKEKFRGVEYELQYRFWKSPNQESIDHWAEQIFTCNGTNKVLINFHSDDSHVSIPVVIDGVETRINFCVDIAKCDLSHSPGLFVLVASMCKLCGFDADRVDGLFQQLQSDIRIQHPNNKVDAYLLLEVQYMVLFSGSTLTTLVNNGGSLILLTHIVVALLSSTFSNEAEVKHAILMAAAAVGYEVTLDAFVATVAPEDLVKLTFLKHFPAYALDGRPVGLKDLSTLLRTFGVSDDECECLARMREIVEGWRNTPQSDLFDCIFEAVELPPSENEVRVDSHWYEYRYGSTVQQLMEALSLLFSFRDAVLVGHPALDAILEVGYGLPRMRELDSKPFDIYHGDENESFGGGLG